MDEMWQRAAHGADGYRRDDTPLGLTAEEHQQRAPIAGPDLRDGLRLGLRAIHLDFGGQRVDVDPQAFALVAKVIIDLDRGGSGGHYFRPGDGGRSQFPAEALLGRPDIASAQAV